MLFKKVTFYKISSYFRLLNFIVKLVEFCNKIMDYWKDVSFLLGKESTSKKHLPCYVNSLTDSQ